MQTNGISQIGIVMWKEKMLKCAAGLCRHDMYMSVFWEEKERDSVPRVQTLWSLSKPHGSGCFLVWDRLVLASQSCLCSQPAFGFFKVSPLSTNPSSDLKVWPCVFCLKLPLPLCSHQLNPRQGFPQCNVLHIHLEGGWEVIKSHLWRFLL